MKRRTRPLAPNRSSSPNPLWLGALALVALALVFVFTRPKEKAPGAASPQSRTEERRGAYSNRSIWRPSAVTAHAETTEKPTIKGTVYDTRGLPVRDATVTAMTFELAGNIPSPAGAVKTDELGRFDLPLVQGTYQLRAEMEGFGPAAATARTGDTIGLVLPASGAIQGRVVDERGRPVSRFVIDVLVSLPGDAPAAPPVFSQRFDSLDGSFRVDRLPVWAVVVRASAAGYAPAYSEDLDVAPGDTAKIGLTLTKGCELTGKVVNASGAAAEGVIVDAEAQIGAGALGDGSVATNDQAESGRDGAFRLENVPMGTVLVRAYDGENAVTTKAIEVTDCARLAPLTLVVSRGGAVTGVVRDGKQSPIAGARLTLMHRSVGFVNTVSDAEGRYRFDRIPVGSARLEVTAGHRTAQQFVTVDDSQETTQDVALYPEGTGEIRGRVIAGGKPLVGVQVLVAAGHGRTRGLDVYTPVTADDGSFHVEKVPDGIYLVSVVSTSVNQSVRIKAGESKTVDIDLSTQLASRRTQKAQGE